MQTAIQVLYDFADVLANDAPPRVFVIEGSSIREKLKLGMATENECQLLVTQIAAKLPDEVVEGEWLKRQSVKEAAAKVDADRKAKEAALLEQQTDALAEQLSKPKP